MFNSNRLNIYDFDIYSKRISFFYNERDRIGTVFGLFLTFIYAIVSLILFFYYLTKTIQRVDVKSQESTLYSQGLPSIDLNPKLFYFAFGLEDRITLSRFLDERIYYPKVYFIQQKKENGILVTKEKISLDIEKCDMSKFVKEFKSQITEGELNNSYCLKDFNLTLVGGSKYEKSSFIEIKIYPCTNNTKNNNSCMEQNIIDSYLTSGYFSINFKDIGLNPSNYSFPIIPIIQNLKTNVDTTMCRELIISLGITEVQTDVGLLSQKLKIDHFLQYRKFSQSFFFINKTEYLKGKEIFSGEIKLEEYIHVQKREYTKMSEVFSTTGGYMQLISTLFALIALLTQNLNIEKKILNRIFNFNIKQRKLILSIQYQKKINCLIHFDKGNFNCLIPFKAKKNVNPYTTLNQQIKNNMKKNENVNKTNKSYSPLMKKFNSGKIYDNKSHSNSNNRNYLDKEEAHEGFKTYKSNVKITSFIDQNINYDGTNNNINNSNNNNNNYSNKSKMLMMFNEDDVNEWPINKVFRKKKQKKENINYLTNIYNNTNNNTNNNALMNFDKELITSIDFNIIDYFCSCGRRRKGNIDIFNLGINFYKNQMNIINIFNVAFMTKIIVTNYLYKKNSIFNQIIEIPLKE